MEKDIYYITRQILHFRLSGTVLEKDTESLVQDFFSLGYVYIVANPSTTEKEWNSSTFDPYIRDSVLPLFLDEGDAVWTATSINSTLPETSRQVPMTKRVSVDTIKASITAYRQRLSFSRIALCGKLPIIAVVDLTRFDSFNRNGNETSTIIHPEDKGEDKTQTSQDEKTEFLLVSDIRTVLSEPEAANRRKKDQGKQYENFHSLLEKLIYANGIPFDTIDKAIGVPAGFSQNCCEDLTSDKLPYRILCSYLTYFGLLEYQYLFKGQCSELRSILDETHTVDQYLLKPATVRTEDRYVLKSVRRGVDTRTAYVYQASFQHTKSQNLKVLILSSNWGLVIGKEYEIDAPHTDDQDSVSSVPTMDTANTKPSNMPTRDEEDSVLHQLEENKKRKLPQQKNESNEYSKKGRFRYLESSEETLKKARGKVLQYIIETNGCSSRDAQTKLSVFNDHPAIVKSFAYYIENKGKFDKYGSRGYSPKRLIKELHYGPYDAFKIMVDLEEDPQNTLQRLKYRATDPQYQHNTSSN